MADRKKPKYNINDFHSSTSSFRRKEQDALNIIITETGNPADIFEQTLISSTTINENLEHLLLKEYSDKDIISFVASANDGLTSNQRKFLVKLKQVLINNNPDSEAPNCERYIDEMMYFLLDQANLDDGLEITMRPCILKLTISNEQFAANAEREGRVNTKLIFVVQEDKHIKSTTYKHGDLQIACSMLAAVQYNYQQDESLFHNNMYGIKVVADIFYFCVICPSQEYIEALYNGLQDLEKHELVIYKFPNKGFKLSNPEDRQHIFKYLTCLRKAALMINC